MICGMSLSSLPIACIKPCTDVASNLLVIDLRLDALTACDGLQQEFQDA